MQDAVEYIPDIPTPPDEWPVGALVTFREDGWPGWSAFYATVGGTDKLMVVISELDLALDDLERCSTPVLVGWTWLQRVLVLEEMVTWDVRPEALKRATGCVTDP